MQVIRGVHPNMLAASVVTLGMFDGVHRGHQALLQACRRDADARQVPAVALTYEPHPSRILHPEHPTRILTTLPEKLALLAAQQMDYVLIPEFTAEFSKLSPEQFLRDIIVQCVHPLVVIAGYRTTFGHARAGTAEVLRQFGARLGFRVEIVEPINVAGGPVSSTRIRQALEAGDVALGAELLGYHYQVNGTVVRGDGRGHELGIPTANLDVPPEKMLPADGVYVVESIVQGVTRRAVMNIGTRPTFDRPRSLEAHLLDFHDDLYGHAMTIRFLARLRDIRTFPVLEALLAQIRQDIATAREVVV